MARRRPHSPRPSPADRARLLLMEQAARKVAAQIVALDAAQADAMIARLKQSYSPLDAYIVKAVAQLRQPVKKAKTV